PPVSAAGRAAGRGDRAASAAPAWSAHPGAHRGRECQRRSHAGRRCVSLTQERKMPRITKVYTRTGDDGSTALGGGQRLPKDAPRIAAYGTVDELNHQLRAARAGGPEP